MDIAEIRRVEENREASMIKIDVRIANGRRGEDLHKMMRSGRIHTERLTRDARFAGIHIGATG